MSISDQSIYRVDGVAQGTVEVEATDRDDAIAQATALALGVCDGQVYRSVEIDKVVLDSGSVDLPAIRSKLPYDVQKCLDNLLTAGTYEVDFTARGVIDVRADTEEEALCDGGCLASDEDVLDFAEPVRVVLLDKCLGIDGYITDAGVSYAYTRLESRYGGDCPDIKTLRTILNAGVDYAAGRRTDAEARLSYLFGSATLILDHREG